MPRTMFTHSLSLTDPPLPLFLSPSQMVLMDYSDTEDDGDLVSSQSDTGMCVCVCVCMCGVGVGG